MKVMKLAAAIKGNLVLLAILCVAAIGQTPNVKVQTVDEGGKPIAGVVVELRQGKNLLGTATTGENGEASLANIPAGTFELTAKKDGLEPRVKTDFVVESGVPAILELLMVAKVNITDTVTVNAATATTNPTEEGASVPAEMQRAQAKDLTIRPATVADTLPLLPGVVRDGQGQLHINGSGENRNALLVNAMDVTDPATGQFGATIPIDSVESVNVYKSPFLAQYGRFTAGVVSVETRRGGDKWNFEVNDPFPEFRYLRGHLRGMHSATPRITFNGPLIKNKLFLSQGIEYELKKTRVISLPFPVNETVNESINSFTQVDYIGFEKHSLTGTVHISPAQARFVNLDFFNQRPVTPNFRGRDYTGTAIDRWTLGNNLLESTFSMKRASLGVWGQGQGEMFMSPIGNTGNYFSQQDRSSSRIEWQEIFTFHPITKFGVHNIKVGSDYTHTDNRGTFAARPVNITDINGALLKRIEFTGGGPYHRYDTEFMTFFQDHWNITKSFSFDLGLRAETQAITGNARYAPRIGLAWTPFGSQSTVVRAGAGMFFDRVPLNVYAFSRYPSEVITTYDGKGNITDGPRTFYNVTEEAIETHTAFIKGRKAIGNFAPYTATWSVEVEHPITSRWKVRANFQRSNSEGLIVINQALVSGNNALVMNGVGQSRYQQFELVSRVKWGENQNLFLSYVHASTTGDLNLFGNFLGSFPSPVIRPNVPTNLPGDLPHRFLGWGVVKLPLQVTWMPMMEWRSGFPYYKLDASQNYVGTPNSDATRYPHFFSFDSRIRRDFKLNNKYSLRVSVSGFNLTNHFNPPTVHNNIADPQYGLFFGQNKRRIRLDFDILF